MSAGGPRATTSERSIAVGARNQANVSVILAQQQRTPADPQGRATGANARDHLIERWLAIAQHSLRRSCFYRAQPDPDGVAVVAVGNKGRHRGQQEVRMVSEQLRFEAWMGGVCGVPNT